MKVFILARQSSGDEQESLSIDSQVEECQKLCDAQGHQAIAVFKDYNTSGRLYPTHFEALAAMDSVYQQFITETGKKGFRKGLGEALVRLDEVDALLVYDFTRLMRPLNGSFLGSLVVQQLQQHSVKVLSVKEGLLDFSTFQAQLLTGLTSSINSEQLRINRDKAKKSMQKLREGGDWCQQITKLFGYRSSGRKHEVEIDEPRAEVVRLAFKRFLEGKTWWQTAKEAAELLAGQKVVKLHKAQYWRMLKNPCYAGYFKLADGSLVKAKPLEGKELVSFADWSMAQEKIASRKGAPRKSSVHFLPLSGRIFCGHCGSPMRVHAGGTYGRMEVRCKAHFLTTRPSCKNGVSWETFQEGGLGFLDAVTPLAAAVYARDLARSASGEGPLREELEALEVELKGLEAKREKTKGLLAKDLISFEECEELLKGLKDKIQETQKQLEGVKEALEAELSPEQKVADLSRAFTGLLDEGELELALRTLIKKCIVYRDRVDFKTSEGDFSLPLKKVNHTKCFPMASEAVQVDEETGEDTYLLVYSFLEDWTKGELKTLLEVGQMKVILACQKQ